MAVVKKICKIAIGTLMAIVFAASTVALIASISQRQTGVPGMFGYSFAVVQTNSMAGTIEVGDIVVGKILDDDTEISQDQIVTFKKEVNNTVITITHRVTEVIEVGDERFYQTWGDNRTYDYEGEEDVCYTADEGYRSRKDIISVYVTKIPAVGKVIEFLKTPAGYVCMAIPVALYIIYEIIALIKLVMENKKEEIMEEVAGGTSEELKEAIIREYLAAQQKAQSTGNSPENENPAPSSENNNSNKNN